MHSTCIDCRNTSHTDDNNLGVVMAVDIYNLVGSSKEHWTTDFKYADGVWNITEFFASPGVMSGESVYFHALISAVSAIRFINNNAASTTPISIATTRSKIPLRKKVATRTMMSLFVFLQRRKKEVQSAIFAATTRRTAAKVVIGINAASGIRTRRMIVKVIQCTIPAIGVRPPLRTLAAVLAIAPVAGIPPKSPEKIFPSPCPISRH